MDNANKYDRIIEAFRRKAAEILPKGSRVALFGSRARGDSKDNSDWDLHILIPGMEKVSWDLWEKYAWPFDEMGIDLNEDVNPRIYSYSGWAKRSSLPFYKNVERDSVIIFQN